MSLIKGLIVIARLRHVERFEINKSKWLHLVGCN